MSSLVDNAWGRTDCTHAERFVLAAGGADNGASSLVLDGANHNLAEPADVAAPAFIKAVAKLLTQIE